MMAPSPPYLTDRVVPDEERKPWHKWIVGGIAIVIVGLAGIIAALAWDMKVIAYEQTQKCQALYKAQQWDDQWFKDFCVVRVQSRNE